MIEIKGKTYGYVNYHPCGSVVYRPQKELTEEGNRILNDAMVELFEALPEEKKKTIYEKYATETVEAI